MDLSDLTDLDRHATWLSTTAAHCRADADELRSCLRCLTWDGYTGSAFREAVAAHARCLDLAAYEFEAAAAAVRAHDAACLALSGPADLASAALNAAAALVPW